MVAAGRPSDSFGPSRLALRQPGRWGLAAVLVLAAIDFFWQLGSSNYFIDEIFSVVHAQGSLGAVLTHVSHTELTPWTYFLALHGWLDLTGSQAEWVTRLPSAVAGVALIAAVYWVAGFFLGRRGALASAGLCALSPLLLQYAQQTRVYVFLALACTLAVGTTLAAITPAQPRRRLLALGAALCVLALWLHYTAAFIVLPLCVWVALQPALPRALRAGFLASCGVAEAVVLPLFVFQHDHQSAAMFPGTRTEKAIHVLEAPFDGRFVGGIDAIRVLGVAVVIAALAAALHPSNRCRLRRPWLLLSVAITGPLAILVAGVAGQDVMISRYAVVAAPFLLITLVAAGTVLPRLPAISLATATVLVTASGLIRSHQTSGFYPPNKTAVEYVRDHRQPGDAVLLGTPAGADLGYYLQTILPSVSLSRDPRLFTQAVARHQRIWLINELGYGPYPNSILIAAADHALGPFHYHVLRVHELSTTTSIAVYLATPTRP
jgi:hypothetical protein